MVLGWFAKILHKISSKNENHQLQWIWVVYVFRFIEMYACTCSKLSMFMLTFIYAVTYKLFVCCIHSISICVCIQMKLLVCPYIRCALLVCVCVYVRVYRFRDGVCWESLPRDGLCVYLCDIICILYAQQSASSKHFELVGSSHSVDCFVFCFPNFSLKSISLRHTHIQRRQTCCSHRQLH